MLTNLENKEKIFHSYIPLYPNGKYAHILLIRETNSYTIFRTDRDLNTAKVGKSLKDDTPITRLVWFKRKQVAPERITGRGVLRENAPIIWEKLSEEHKKELEHAFSEGNYNCEYNEINCQACPDCIYYGYAIGGAEEGGSEKSKVFVDSAFSITSFEDSHEEFSFNALFEYGTMTDPSGKTRESFGAEDHVVPEVFFPSIVTIKDPTEPEFLYILNNILRTKRYGAETTRGGSVENHVVGIVFSDGEIFSNLKFTKAITDQLMGEYEENNQPEHKELKHPLRYKEVIEASQSAIEDLITSESIRIIKKLSGNELEDLLHEVISYTSSEEKLSSLIEKAFVDVAQYRKLIKESAPTKKGKGKK
ncbi:type I-D CRISPR-associated protein Cas7/Csc2 [Methylacidiphilum caldifontis]|uniref:Type I-D CRISPR-associated protein Cas7/Csc2 n=1 Tax=Methylacidiphilum caldifontis TaxID=2795386 RepID=A0A4Y8PAE1_9BACT|nr:type I-D CRISPR-associated protein Cas7/Csc2 [Methylacidiphilum caldifontis]TFE67814.1 type I-D CRISPR-associated protein Cas7/Csc2 [Methylacidiphilum caldifontis]